MPSPTFAFYYCTPPMHTVLRRRQMQIF